MTRYIGTQAMGLRCKIIRPGDDIVDIAVDTVINAESSGSLKIEDNDIIGITEAVVAKAQNNFASIEDIKTDVKNKFNCDEIAVVHPIMSRNRFAICLKGIAGAVKKVFLLLSYPHDELGNHIISVEDLENSGLNPYGKIINEKKFREHFSNTKHIFTDIDYIEYYKKIIEDEGAEAEILFGNNVTEILNYCKNVLNCDIHTRDVSKTKLKNSGAQKVCSLSDILNKSVNGSGYNLKYGLLGSNKSTEDRVKLFPNNCQNIVEDIQKKIKEISGKKVHVLVYGDGAFKDPVGKIWELADPVVSPAFTKELSGTPNELKLKYIADNEYVDLEGDKLVDAMKEKIKNKDKNLKGSMETQGTTPRRLSDLIGSLCDLTSGSGDKGTPIVYIKGYFDSFAVD